MAYHVRPPDPQTVIEREREERAREEVRKNAAEVARETQRMNMEQEALEQQQRADREERRREREAEEREASVLADDIEREQRVQGRAKRILAERGIEDVEAFL